MGTGLGPSQGLAVVPTVAAPAAPAAPVPTGSVVRVSPIAGGFRPMVPTSAGFNPVGPTGSPQLDIFRQQPDAATDNR